MKKIIYIASILCAVLFTGCEDFLTTESPDFSTDRYWRDKNDVEAALSAVYGQLDNRTSSYSVAEKKYVVETFRSDEMSLGQDVYNYPDWFELYNFSYNNENSSIKEYWMNNYNGINYANNVLFGINKVQQSGKAMSQEDVNTLTGEAKFLRAYYHFKLIINWEKIIIRDEFLTGEVQTHKALSERKAAWDFICAELKEAGSLLPQDRPSAQAGRATKGAAYAYLGWAYLTRAYEEAAEKDQFLNEAKDALQKVTGYELESDFRSMFDGTNKNCKESVFELQFTNSTDNGTYHKHVLHYWVAPVSMKGWDEIRVSEMMYNEYLKEGRIAENGMYDNRAYSSMFFNDPFYHEGGHILGYNYDDVYNDLSVTKYNFSKYMPSTWEDHARSAVGTNMPLMRYANVMLMLAEVHNEQGHPENAVQLINKVRQVHGNLPAMEGSDQNAVRAQIEHERLVEFALENYRFYDLRRWGKLEKAMQADGRKNFDINRHAFLPIPLMEIQTNNEINE